jgi:hypothetical protein
MSAYSVAMDADAAATIVDAADTMIIIADAADTDIDSIDSASACTATVADSVSPHNSVADCNSPHSSVARTIILDCEETLLQDSPYICPVCPETLPLELAIPDIGNREEEEGQGMQLHGPINFDVPSLIGELRMMPNTEKPDYDREVLMLWYYNITPETICDKIKVVLAYDILFPCVYKFGISTIPYIRWRHTYFSAGYIMQIVVAKSDVAQDIMDLEICLIDKFKGPCCMNIHQGGNGPMHKRPPPYYCYVAVGNVNQMPDLEEARAHFDGDASSSEESDNSSPGH